jgi:hypothetical protein
MCAATVHSRAGDNPERRWLRGEGIRRRPCHQVLVYKISKIYDFRLVALFFGCFKQTDNVTTPTGTGSQAAALRDIWGG